MIHQHKRIWKEPRGSSPWGKGAQCWWYRFSIGFVGGLICCSMCLRIEAPLDLADLDHCVFGSSSWACEGEQRELWPWSSCMESNLPMPILLCRTNQMAMTKDKAWFWKTMVLGTVPQTFLGWSGVEIGFNIMWELIDFSLKACVTQAVSWGDKRWFNLHFPDGEIHCMIWLN